MIINVKELKKIYDVYSIYPKKVIENLEIQIKEGEFISVMGSSGSGKTTLINILSTIDDATSGKVELFGENILTLSEKAKAEIRKSKVGFIFQSYNLIESLTIKDNIMFAMRLNNQKNKEEQEKEVLKLARQLGIEDTLNKYPSECSGGQQQKSAIARALIMKPLIIFADEPTGNLDSHSTKELMNIFKEINETTKTTIIMVTHDSLVASYTAKMYYMKDGNIDINVIRGEKTQEEYYKEIVKISTDMDLNA